MHRAIQTQTLNRWVGIALATCLLWAAPAAKAQGSARSATPSPRLIVGDGGGGANVQFSFSKPKEKCKTKNEVTLCKDSVTVAALNDGDADSSPIHIRIFLSPDNAYDPGIDTQAAEFTVPILAPGKSKKGKLSQAFDHSLGGMFLFAVDDNDNVLASIQFP